MITAKRGGELLDLANMTQATSEEDMAYFSAVTPASFLGALLDCPFAKVSLSSICSSDEYRVGFEVGPVFPAGHNCTEHWYHIRLMIIGGCNQAFYELGTEEGVDMLN